MCCVGKVCGGDGCGGTCDDACPCAPDCEGEDKCGGVSDGCGGTCDQACPVGQVERARQAFERFETDGWCEPYGSSLESVRWDENPFPVHIFLA